MKAIVKGPEPRELLNWKAQNKETPQNLRYGHAAFPAETVRRALLREQFHLCAYTMKPLKTAAACEAEGVDTRWACHVEHILPQSRQVPGEDIDYLNMVACFPPSRFPVACGYGATAKASFDPATRPFVSPLSHQPERHFGFDSRGNVSGLTPAGQTTIDVLNLNHAALVNDRAAVIRGALMPRRGRPLTAAAARRLADQVMVADSQGSLPPYCVAVASAARAFAEKEERRAARMRSNDAR